MAEYCDKLSREEKEKNRNPKKYSPKHIQMNTGLMADFEFDSELDGIVIDSVPYVCINAPDRPNILGPNPVGTTQLNSAMLIAPEANVQMDKLHDGSYILQKKDEEEEEDGDGE